MQKNKDGKTIFYQAGHLKTIASDLGARSILYAMKQPLVEYGPAGMTEVGFLIVDLPGSVLSMFAKQKKDQYNYTSYGFSLDSNGMDSTLRFNSERFDEVSVMYLLGNGNRSYRPELMRFMSPDEYSPFETGGINTYSYCAADPVNFTDPSGNNPLRSFAKFLGNITGMRVKGASKNKKTTVEHAPSTPDAGLNHQPNTSRPEPSLPRYSISPAENERTVLKPEFYKTEDNLEKVRTLKEAARQARIKGNQTLLLNGGLQNIAAGKPLTPSQIKIEAVHRIRQAKYSNEANVITRNWKQRPPKYSKS